MPICGSQPKHGFLLTLKKENETAYLKETKLLVPEEFFFYFDFQLYECVVFVLLSVFTFVLSDRCLVILLLFEEKGCLSIPD